jgi:hypothetical protein
LHKVFKKEMARGGRVVNRVTGGSKEGRPLWRQRVLALMSIFSDNEPPLVYRVFRRF